MCSSRGRKTRIHFFLSFAGSELPRLSAFLSNHRHARAVPRVPGLVQAAQADTFRVIPLCNGAAVEHPVYTPLSLALSSER